MRSRVPCRTSTLRASPLAIQTECRIFIGMSNGKGRGSAKLWKWCRRRQDARPASCAGFAGDGRWRGNDDGLEGYLGGTKTALARVDERGTLLDYGTLPPAANSAWEKSRGTFARYGLLIQASGSDFPEH